MATAVKPGFLSSAPRLRRSSLSRDTCSSVYSAGKAATGFVLSLLLPVKGGGRTCEKFCHFRVVVL